MGIKIIIGSIFAAFAVAPIVLTIGWIRWFKHSQPNTVFAFLSLIGFGFGTAAALMAIAFMLYARITGGFPYYDPLVLKIYRWGLLLSLSGLVFGVGGICRPNTLRWFAPTLSLCTLLVWVGLASTE